MIKTVILIGAPGCGKTSCGQALADKLGWSFIDTDQLIEKASGLSIADIFASAGESYFRQLERELLENLSQQSATGRLKNHVIGCGGGLPVAASNFELLSRLGEIVCLTAPLSKLVERLSRQGGRPLLGNRSAASSNASCSNADSDMPAHRTANKPVDTHPQGNSADNCDSEQLRTRLAELLSLREAHYRRARHIIDTSGLNEQEVAVQIVKLLNISA